MWAPTAQLGVLQLGGVSRKLCPPVGLCRLCRTGVRAGVQSDITHSLQDGWGDTASTDGHGWVTLVGVKCLEKGAEGLPAVCELSS